MEVEVSSVLSLVNYEMSMLSTAAQPLREDFARSQKL